MKEEPDSLSVPYNFARRFNDQCPQTINCLRHLAAQFSGFTSEVRIPMANGVDSLNVAAASAIAFWQLRVKNHETLPSLPDDVHI